MIKKVKKIAMNSNLIAELFGRVKYYFSSKLIDGFLHFFSNLHLYSQSNDKLRAKTVNKIPWFELRFAQRNACQFPRPFLLSFCLNFQFTTLSMKCVRRLVWNFVWYHGQTQIFAFRVYFLMVTYKKNEVHNFSRWNSCETLQMKAHR